MIQPRGEGHTFLVRHSTKIAMSFCLTLHLGFHRLAWLHACPCCTIFRRACPEFHAAHIPELVCALGESYRTLGKRA